MAEAGADYLRPVRERIDEIESKGIPQTLEGLIRYLRPILGAWQIEHLWDSLDFADDERAEEPITAYDYWKDIYLQHVENPSISVVLQNKAESIQASIKMSKIDSLKKELRPRLSRVQFRIVNSFLEEANYEYYYLDASLKILEDTKNFLDEIQTLIEAVKPSFSEEELSSLKTELDSKNLSEVKTHLQSIKTEKGL
jgi:DNA repair exonuclease SbcCD nuclease subunit